MVVAPARFGGGGGGFDYPAFTSPGARRCWRIYQNAADGGGAILALSELHFRLGGTDLSGTLISSGTSGGSLADLLDNNTGTIWYHFDANPWVGIDCGVGMSSALEDIRMCCRVDGFASQACFDWQLEWADDPAGPWTRSVSFHGTHWENVLGYWKVFYAEPYIARIAVDASQISPASLYTIGQLEFRDSPGGSDITSPQGTSEEANGAIVGNFPGGGGTTPNAFNDNQASDSYNGNQGLPGYTEFRFPSDPGIVQIMMQTRNSIFFGQTPASFNFELSRDGETWNSKLFNSLPWTVQSQIQTFDI